MHGTVSLTVQDNPYAPKYQLYEFLYDSSIKKTVLHKSRLGVLPAQRRVLISAQDTLKRLFAMVYS